MPNISPSTLQIGSTIGALVLALLTIFIRLRASNKPVTVKKIIIPPLGMSTGFLMFVAPMTHIPLWWGVIALFVGWFLFSYPLIRSTHFKKLDGLIYAERSRSFIVILLGLLVVRTILHQVIEQYVSIAQSGALFFLLAFGMILRWRLFMYKEYQLFLRD
ncbi:membrane protein CcdC involved in cytochrome C biogenesis [Paenibacillus sp. DS2015]|uniref:CcdC family protein n=1 Tax=Paenibacillus sp. DS2015 TaxID=3373917 RepID=UPI003D237401